ncbi:hypothetical protein Dimus_025549 [Dionaea muscipula]
MEPETRHGLSSLDAGSCYGEPEIEPLTGKPCVHLILSRTHVKPHFQMIVPAKMARHLPHAVVPVIVTTNGRSWEMTYDGQGPQRSHKKFMAGWKAFVEDNRIELGDACVFEILESSSKAVKLKVQILRGKFPAELLERVNGESIDSPIIVDD